MTDLIACLSTGKGTWGAVTKLVNSGKFDNIYLVTNDFGQEKYSAPDNAELIVVNTRDEEKNIRDQVHAALDGKIKDTEVAVNFTSGSGAEHMAVLSAIIKLGLGMRLVVPGEEDFEEL